MDGAGNLLLKAHWRGFTGAEASFEPAAELAKCAEGLVIAYCATVVDNGPHGGAAAGAVAGMLDELRGRQRVRASQRSNHSE